MVEPAILVSDLWKVYGAREAEALAAARSGASKEALRERHGAVLGLAEVTLTIGRGEIFCLMGLSGSGKSTLLRHVNGLVRPSAGTVRIDGVDIGALGAAALRQLRAEKLGMVFQSFALLPHRTVAENVAFGLELRGVPHGERMARAAEMLARVRLGGWDDRWLDELSGGMQQRVGLARALAGDPPILLMDEPFGALDPVIRRQLQDEFVALVRGLGKTVVFVTHDLDEALRIGDRIAVMRDGRIVQTGRPAEILRNPADAYVAEFVAGVSPLKVLTAADAMRPLSGAPPEGARTVAADLTLDAAAALSAGAAAPLVVVAPGGRPLGTLAQADLLRAIAGGAAP